MPATPPPPPPPPPAAVFPLAGESSSSSQLFQQAARHQECLERYRLSPELRRTPSLSVAPSINFPPPLLPPHLSAGVAAMSLGPLPGPSASMYLSNNMPTPPPSAPVTFNGRQFTNLPSHLAAYVEAVNQQEHSMQSRRGTQPLPVSFTSFAWQLNILNVTYRFLPLLLLLLALLLLLLLLDLDLALLLLLLSPLLLRRF